MVTSNLKIKAELLQQETAEELHSLRSDYETLSANYQSLLRIETDRRRDREQIAAIAVLRDKLEAKDHELLVQVICVARNQGEPSFYRNEESPIWKDESWKMNPAEHVQFIPLLLCSQ